MRSAEKRIANSEKRQGDRTMKSQTAQWILCAITMTVFLWLSLSGHFNWLAVAIVASSFVRYALVPRAKYR
jgi:hypothetical protein